MYFRAVAKRRSARVDGGSAGGCCGLRAGVVELGLGRVALFIRECSHEAWCKSTFRFKKCHGPLMDRRNLRSRLGFRTPMTGRFHAKRSGEREPEIYADGRRFRYCAVRALEWRCSRASPRRLRSKGAQGGADGAIVAVVGSYLLWLKRLQAAVDAAIVTAKSMVRRAVFGTKRATTARLKSAGAEQFRESLPA